MSDVVLPDPVGPVKTMQPALPSATHTAIPSTRDWSCKYVKYGHNGHKLHAGEAGALQSSSGKYGQQDGQTDSIWAGPIQPCDVYKFDNRPSLVFNADIPHARGRDT
jgi:hypothetical protein